MTATLTRTATAPAARPAAVDLSLVVAVDALGSPARPRPDVVEEWGLQSFPASDPPANW